MPFQKILQRGDGPGAVPKCHVFYLGDKSQLCDWNQPCQLLSSADRRAAAAIDIICRAAKNQGRHFDLFRIAQRVPRSSRVVMIAKLFGTGLPFPKGARKGCDDLWMVAIKP